MGTVWKIVLTLAVILLISATGTMLTGANVDIITAQNYMEEVSAIIKESNYNQMIIDQCQQEAVENGYELEIEVYRNAEYMNSSYARVYLYYQYHLPLFKITEKKMIERII